MKGKMKGGPIEKRPLVLFCFRLPCRIAEHPQEHVNDGEQDASSHIQERPSDPVLRLDREARRNDKNYGCEYRKDGVLNDRQNQDFFYHELASADVLERKHRNGPTEIEGP